MKRILAIFILCCMFLVSAKSLFAVNYEAYKIFLQGVFNLKAKRIDAGIKNYEKVISLDKNAFVVYKDLVYLYWQLGDAEKAFQAADKINEIDKNNPQTTTFLTTFYLVGNKPDIAKQFWERTIKLDPENEMATASIASYYYYDNKFKESAKYWQKFLDQQPNNSIGYFYIGMAQEKLDMNNEALASYNKVIQLNPEIGDAYISKARIYETLGKFDLAIKEYEKYISIFPNNTDVLICLGKCYYEIQNYAKAKDIFLKVEKSFPNNIMAIYCLGIIYEKTGQINKAVAEFERLILQEDKNIILLSKLGYYYLMLRDYTRAEKQFLKVLYMEPSNNEILYSMALNYMDWGKYDKAVEYFNKTIELMPNFPEAYFYLGLTYNKNKDFVNAEKVLLKAIQLNPDNSKAMNYLGYTYADKGIKFNESETFLIRAVTLEPKNGAYLDSLGWLYYRQGKFEDAEKLLFSAVNVTRDPIIYDHLGDTYFALGKTKEAWMAYALSYDFKQDKAIKRKLDFVQAKIPKEELYKHMLLRSESNYLRVLSFRTGYKIRLNSGFLSKNIYTNFFYTKGSNIKIDFPNVIIPGGIHISISDEQNKISPKAVNQIISKELFDVILQLCEVFKGNFYKYFDDAEVSVEGKHITYSKDEAKLTLNIDTALIEEFSQNNTTVNVIKYDNFFISKIPSKIRFNFSDMKITGILEATKIFYISESSSTKKNENNSQSAGEN
ncbi:MAG: tetratricopeptide repeat protein [Endomicrobium sp.]|jgi:tetratricopeptide (TPR) repeat protein|nr:tetratricopeptide repeat protein [Endomicrobium sp.]